MLFRPDRNLAELADDRTVTLVVRMNRDRAVAEHRFRARRRRENPIARFLEQDFAVLVALDVAVSRAAIEWIFEVPHVAVHFAIIDLEVADRGLELRIPVRSEEHTSELQSR